MEDNNVYNVNCITINKSRIRENKQEYGFDNDQLKCGNSDFSYTCYELYVSFNYHGFVKYKKYVIDRDHYRLFSKIFFKKYKNHVFLNVRCTIKNIDHSLPTFDFEADLKNKE